MLTGTTIHEIQHTPTGNLTNNKQQLHKYYMHHNNEPTKHSLRAYIAYILAHCKSIYKN